MQRSWIGLQDNLLLNPICAVAVGSLLRLKLNQIKKGQNILNIIWPKQGVYGQTNARGCI